MNRRTFISGCLGLGVVAATGYGLARIPVERERWYLFGTLVDVTLAGVEPAEARGVLGGLSAALQRMNDDWHPWKPGVMGDINDAIARGEPIGIDGHMQHMLDQVGRIYGATDGAFNPAIGGIVGAWGFHGGGTEGWRPPSDELVDGLLSAAPKPTDLAVHDDMLSSCNAHVQLDLGGYAKGYALTLGMRLLEQRGVRNALINAGGDLLTLGDAEPGIAGRPWRVAVRHPQRPGSIAWLDTQGGEAVLTSGNYERFHEYAGRRYPHIIDPRTGRPACEVASATVIHRDAALADAAATALVVSGMRNWRDTAAALGIEQAMMVDDRGRVEMTPAMRERVHLDA
jgi:thiamine biosynthesis lipoprotein